MIANDANEFRHAHAELAGLADSVQLVQLAASHKLGSWVKGQKFSVHRLSDWEDRELDPLDPLLIFPVTSDGSHILSPWPGDPVDRNQDYSCRLRHEVCHARTMPPVDL